MEICARSAIRIKIDKDEVEIGNLSKIFDFSINEKIRGCHQSKAKRLFDFKE
jgi:hypothetical protein